MTKSPMASVAALLACLGLTAGLAGCWIKVDKDANGHEKKVQVDTPFGGIHVNTDQTTAADLGLPVYPGAQVVRDNQNDKSADVNLGFGEWALHVKVVNYSTSDSQDKVATFYKGALSRYGDVITCQGNAPVGTPTRTSEGLTCADNGHDKHVNVDTGGYKSGDGDYQLRAGSERHQHIVGFERSSAGQTRFALVALDLPNVDAGGPNKSN